MGESIDFIKDRAVKTISAARAVQATWTWQEKTVAAQEAQLEAITGNSAAAPPVVGQEELTSQAEQTMLAARGIWDTALDQLHRWTMQGVGMAKSRFRDDPAKSASLTPLAARGNSRSATLAEALAWESAWAKVDATWAPLPANTLAAFKALRKQCAEDLQNAYSDARAAWRDEAEQLGVMAAALEDVNEAWYADATRIFPAGTTEGNMIRGTVPTTYSPTAAAPAKPTPPATP